MHIFIYNRSMKIVNLMENTQGSRPGYFEHGLSIYVETEHHKIIVDTGQSEKTWDNAKLLGIDLSQVDSIFLSHGHYDHSGGILSLMEYNPDCTIYLHQKAGMDYFSMNKDIEKYIGIDKEILNLKNLQFISKDTVIDDEISIFCDVTSRRLWPQSNLRLKKLVKNELLQDTFDHEMYIVIQSEGKSYLFSGCAHNGIINILDKFKDIYKKDPDVVISGFHMMKKNGLTQSDIEMIQDIGKELSQKQTMFYTGHCTGIEAYEILKEILRDKIQYMHSLDVLGEENENIG